MYRGVGCLTFSCRVKFAKISSISADEDMAANALCADFESTRRLGRIESGTFFGSVALPIYTDGYKKEQERVTKIERVQEFS